MRALARRLMKKHGLLRRGWKFDFEDTRVVVGRCRPLISGPAVDGGWPVGSWKGTMLHEIAHGLVGDPGHSERWRSKCIEIGGDGEVVATRHPHVRAPWTAICPLDPSHRWTHYRRVPDGYCLECWSPPEPVRVTVRWVRTPPPAR